MALIELNDSNAFDHSKFIGEDMAENMAREFFRGFLIMTDDGEDMQAGIIWEYHDFEEDADTVSVIEWIKINDPDAEEKLFEEYTSRVREEGARRSKFVIPVKDSKNEKAALKNAGFSARLTEGDNIIVELHELSELPIMKNHKVPDNIGVIGELTLRKFRKGLTRCTMHGKKGLCQDLAYLSMNWFETDVSCYSYDEDNITGFFLFHKLPSGMLSIQLMIGFDKNVQQNLLGMIKKFIISMEENYPPDTKILLNRHTQASLQLTEKLLPRGFGIPVYAGEREE